MQNTREMRAGNVILKFAPSFDTEAKISIAASRASLIADATAGSSFCMPQEMEMT